LWKTEKYREERVRKESIKEKVEMRNGRSVSGPMKCGERVCNKRYLESPASKRERERACDCNIPLTVLYFAKKTLPLVLLTAVWAFAVKGKE